ncbi:hypothetical protein [Gemmatimonas phototrophica]|uniref:hypothetical protein n=1 Tax=Gemmatimonas phototrophica TaxID=1379270 RepID=UPI000A745FA0|nr:hypothetical protein [Gemmatimonas phototrophica]
MEHSTDTASRLEWELKRLLVFFAIGLGYIVVLRTSGFIEPDKNSLHIYYRVIAIAEPWIVTLMFFFFAFFWWSFRRETRNVANTIGSEQHIERNVSWFSVGMAALGIALATWFARGLITEGTLFSMDEYGAALQSEMLAKRELTSTFPAQWKQWRNAVTPVFVQRGNDGSSWVLMYLPGYSFLSVLFNRFGADGWLNPSLTGLGMVAIAGLSRQEWRGQAERQWVAILVYSGSTQVLATSLTGYVMPAHLTMNLFWLWALRSKSRVRYLTAPLGFFACVLHQPVPHPLFALPFLTRKLREQDWRLLMACATAYACAFTSLLYWSHLGGVVRGALSLPTLGHLFVLVANVVLLAAWNTPIAAVLLSMAIKGRRRLESFEGDLFAGILLSLGFYLFFSMVNQGHGWGWRYGHQVLGNLALISAALWPCFTAQVGSIAARRALKSSLLFTVLVQVPYRAWEVQHFTRPFTLAHNWLSRVDADVVIVPSDSVWYGRDLIRNSPGLSNRPILVDGAVAAEIGIQHLPVDSKAKVMRVSVEELRSLGLEAIK